jgi:FlaA1/EpsC-like NDP-sugar epimerase
VIFAYALRFEFNYNRIQLEYLPTFPYVIGSITILTLLSLWFFKMYKRIWEYASIGDLISILQGVVSSVVIFFLIHFLLIQAFFQSIVVPRSIFVLTAILSIGLLGASRLIWRMIRDQRRQFQAHQRKVLVVGAGYAGAVVVKELKHAQSQYYPVAFIDDNDRKQRLEVLGVPVVGNRHDIPHIVDKYEIQDIIIALPSSRRSEISEIITIAENTGVEVKIVPNIHDVMSGKVTLGMRDVSPEDLLGREPVRLASDEMSQNIAGKTILITGAGGSIGAELCRQLITLEPARLLLLGHGENSIYEIELELRNSVKSNIELIPIIADIQDIERLRMVFATYRPAIIFHAAAHKHVPLMEFNPSEAVKNNIFGTRNVAACAHEYEAERFVMISTDKAVNPTNMMGATKRIAEMIVQDYHQQSRTIFSAVRFGNVLGSRGSVIPLFKKQIESGGPVTVTHPEMIRYFMTIPEAVSLVIQTVTLSRGGEVFLLDMGKPVRITALAEDLIRSYGYEPYVDIQIEYTGIRPGEKLYEEMLTAEEGVRTTKHDKIYIGRTTAPPHEELMNQLDHLASIIHQSKPMQEQDLKQVVQKMVPNYTVTESSSERLGKLKVQNAHG